MSGPLLEVEDLVVRFPAPGTGWLGFGRETVRAVNGVSLTLAPGETLGLVGESGCGKSTLGRAILCLLDITSGRIVFDGVDVTRANAGAISRLRRETAMVFQDPYGSLNPRLSAGEAIAEVLRVHRKVPPERVKDRVAELMSLVGLRPDLAARRPAALSGGQCQRVGIARALAIEPKLVIADECVAALDVSIQAQIINLLIELRRRMDLSLIFIAHDLAVVRRLCDRVVVMYLGRIVEEGPTERVFSAPKHPYTESLIRAIPEIDPDSGLPDRPLGGEPPSPLGLPSGCAFHPRCPKAVETCSSEAPPIVRTSAGRIFACRVSDATEAIP